jgi:DNA-binding MarR family transcriptional regulator
VELRLGPGVGVEATVALEPAVGVAPRPEPVVGVVVATTAPPQAAEAVTMITTIAMLRIREPISITIGLPDAHAVKLASTAARDRAVRRRLAGRTILNVMLNVPATRSTNSSQTVDDTGRQALERELLEEMTGWSPKDRGGVFKSWHRHALSLVHLNVLTALEAEGPLSMKQLAEAMDVSDASATGIVDRMEKRGLVERRHGTEDRRVVRVHATEAGFRVFSDMAAHRRGVLTKVLAELTEDEMASLLVGMRAIHAARRRLVGELDSVATGPQSG